MDKRSDKMTYDEDNDLFQPTTFKDKIKEKTPDIFYFGLMVFTFTFAAFGNKNNQVDANTAIQTVNQVQEVKQTNAVLLNDSINHQKIR